MLRILGHEFKHFLRGGRWLFLLLPIISAAFFIWLGGQGVLSSVTADQAVTSANTYCLAAVAVSLYVIASFDEDEKSGIASLAASSGSRSGYFSGKVLFSYISAVVTEALTILAGLGMYRYMGFDIVGTDPENVLAVACVYAAAAALMATVTAFVVSVGKRASYGFYAIAVMYFVPAYALKYINGIPGLDSIKNGLTEFIMNTSVRDLFIVSGAEAACALALLIIFTLINRKKSV